MLHHFFVPVFLIKQSWKVFFLHQKQSLKVFFWLLTILKSATTTAFRCGRSVCCTDFQTKKGALSPQTIVSLTAGRH